MMEVGFVISLSKNETGESGECEVCSYKQKVENLAGLKNGNEDVCNKFLGICMKKLWITVSINVSCVNGI